MAASIYGICRSGKQTQPVCCQSRGFLGYTLGFLPSVLQNSPVHCSLNFSINCGKVKWQYTCDLNHICELEVEHNLSVNRILKDRTGAICIGKNTMIKSSRLENVDLSTFFLQLKHGSLVKNVSTAFTLLSSLFPELLHIPEKQLSRWEKLIIFA